jgi:hypothetical protein
MMVRRIENPALTTQRRSECAETLEAMAAEFMVRPVSNALLEAAAIIRAQLRLEEIAAAVPPAVQPLVRLGQGAYRRDIGPGANGRLVDITT